MVFLSKRRAPQPESVWRPLAQAYQVHHLACSTCLAVGRGIFYGARCAAGAALWHAYQSVDD